MSYSNPQTVTITTGAILTTAAAATMALRGPKGKTGRLVDVIARASVANHALGTTTPTTLLVGKAGDTDAYATFFPAAMTIPTATALTDDPGASNIVGIDIPADTVVLLTTVANNGGSPTGTITYDVIIDWF